MKRQVTKLSVTETQFSTFISLSLSLSLFLLHLFRLLGLGGAKALEKAPALLKNEESQTKQQFITKFVTEREVERREPPGREKSLSTVE